MTLEELTDVIIIELDDSSITRTSVALWLIGSISVLNLKLGTEYEYVPLTEEETEALEEGDFAFGDFLPELEDFDAAYFAEMYYCNFLQKKARKNSYVENDWIEMTGTGQGTIRRASNVSQAQEMRIQYELCLARLKDLMGLYNKGKMAPAQYLLNGRISSSDMGLISPCCGGYSSFF